MTREELLGRLVWQIDHDDELGRLFVMVEREDLLANDLSRARVDWQAH